MVLQECLLMRHGQETLYLRRRSGFVRAALAHGAALVPAFAFGQVRCARRARRVRSVPLRTVATAVRAMCRTRQTDTVWGRGRGVLRARQL
jgi:Diacylglycerol acyltransferase